MAPFSTCYINIKPDILGADKCIEMQMHVNMKQLTILTQYFVIQPKVTHHLFGRHNSANENAQRHQHDGEIFTRRISFLQDDNTEDHVCY